MWGYVGSRGLRRRLFAKSAAVSEATQNFGGRLHPTHWEGPLEGDEDGGKFRYVTG
jgi:hypothetical protein